MKIVDLTGDNRVVVGFHTDLMPDGSVIGRFELSKAVANGIAVGDIADQVPTIDEIQIQFDKPESVAVFIHQLQRGYNKMSLLLMQEQYRKEAVAQAKKAEDKAAKQVALKERIEQMARELSALQGQYAELND